MAYTKTPSGAVPAPLPENEPTRLEALRSYELLDTSPEPAYDDLVLIASAICRTPIALLTLVDERRQWFKARVGLSVTETSRDAAFCAHAILHTEPLIVTDTLEDDRFATNPLVTGEPHIRFYAGVPLVDTDGHALGTLCAIDREPRFLTRMQRDALVALGHQAQMQLELRRTVVRLRNALEEPQNKPEPAPEVSGDRARQLLVQTDEMRARIRALLARLDDVQQHPKP